MSCLSYRFGQRWIPRFAWRLLCLASWIDVTAECPLLEDYFVTRFSPRFLNPNSPSVARGPRNLVRGECNMINDWYTLSNTMAIEENFAEQDHKDEEHNGNRSISVNLCILGGVHVPIRVGVTEGTSWTSVENCTHVCVIFDLKNSFVWVTSSCGPVLRNNTTCTPTHCYVAQDACGAENWAISHWSPKTLSVWILFNQ